MCRSGIRGGARRTEVQEARVRSRGGIGKQIAGRKEQGARTNEQGEGIRKQGAGKGAGSREQEAWRKEQ
jgi:hypothetical protein